MPSDSKKKRDQKKKEAAKKRDVKKPTSDGAAASKLTDGDAEDETERRNGADEGYITRLL